jgi:hypothetical protein
MSQHAILTVILGCLHARIQTRRVAAAIEHYIQRKKNCAVQRISGERERERERDTDRQRESDLTICPLFLKDQDVTIGPGNVRQAVAPSDPALHPVREFIPKHEVQSPLRARNLTPVSNPKHAAGCHIKECSGFRLGSQGATQFM